MLVYGRNVAKEILEKDKIINKIFLQKGFEDKTILSLIEKKKIGPIFCEKRKMDDLAGGVHQGIILDIEDFVYCELEDMIQKEDAFVVILDHIEDPHNLGAIIRTCEASGVDGIILPKNRSVSVNATVMKTSAGALENVSIASVVNLKKTIERLKKNGFWIVGTDMVNSTDYRKIDYSGKIALVIGSEGFGMSSLVKKNCDVLIKIPMKGNITSINASVSAGIAIYEVVKQRGEK